MPHYVGLFPNSQQIGPSWKIKIEINKYCITGQATVAQWVRQQTAESYVPGSNPAVSISLELKIISWIRATNNCRIRRLKLFVWVVYLAGQE
jgi:hypothetical protein